MYLLISIDYIHTVFSFIISSQWQTRGRIRLLGWLFGGFLRWLLGWFLSGLVCSIWDRIAGVVPISINIAQGLKISALIVSGKLAPGRGSTGASWGCVPTWHINHITRARYGGRGARVFLDIRYQAIVCRGRQKEAPDDIRRAGAIARATGAITTRKVISIKQHNYNAFTDILYSNSTHLITRPAWDP